MNKQEVANEVIVLVCSYVLLCYTEFLTDMETRFMVGWFHMSLIGLNVVMNLTFMFYVIFSDCIRKCKLRMARRRALKALEARKKDVIL